MTKQDVINLIDCEIEGENNNYKEHMKNNPDDKQRVHDHAVFMSAFILLLDDLNTLF